MKIMHEYKGWIIYNNFVAHGCPEKKEAHRNALHYEELGTNPIGAMVFTVSCGTCKEEMPPDVLEHLQNVLRFTKLYG